MDYPKIHLHEDLLGKPQDIRILETPNEVALQINYDGKVIHRGNELDWNNDAQMAEAFRDFIRMQFPQFALKEE